MLSQSGFAEYATVDLEQCRITEESKHPGRPKGNEPFPYCCGLTPQVVEEAQEQLSQSLRQIQHRRQLQCPLLKCFPKVNHLSQQAFGMRFAFASGDDSKAAKRSAARRALRRDRVVLAE
jgi:hypothetical protein